MRQFTVGMIVMMVGGAIGLTAGALRWPIYIGLGGLVAVVVGFAVQMMYMWKVRPSTWHRPPPPPRRRRNQ